MKISFQPLATTDFENLLKWLQKPHVKKWWDTDLNYTLELIQEKYGSYVDGYKKIGPERKPIHAFIIYFDDTPIGYIQYYNAYDFPRDGYQLNNLPKSLAAIDIFIGDENYLGKGIGAKSLELFLDSYAFAKFDYAFVDPDGSNLAAIKTYEKACFKPFDDQISESVIMMVKPRNDFREIESLEKKLLVSTTRKSINTLDDLLADDFKEFGKSGFVYNKQDILSRLPREEPKEFNAKYFEVKSLGDTAYLINFRTLESGIEVLRSSIWESIDGRLQMVFHQGTIIDGEEK
jgi:aminoglycoside 6'-N-acetyltransferase